jgi:RNA polymerase sigma-70 factor (family 1)
MLVVYAAFYLSFGSDSLLCYTDMLEEFYHLQEQIAGGDQKALKELYRIFYKKLVQFAYVLVRSRELSEEVVEDVFIKLWHKKEQIREIHNLRVYLYVATKNTALNYLSKKASELITAPFDYLEINMESLDASPEQLMITAEMIRKIQAAVDALPPRCKIIFKLIREDGLKYKEVSDVLGISINTIDSQMAIAVKRISMVLPVNLMPKGNRQGVGGKP